MGWIKTKNHLMLLSLEGHKIVFILMTGRTVCWPYCFQFTLKVSKASENIRIAISIYHLLSVLLASFLEQDKQAFTCCIRLSNQAFETIHCTVYSYTGYSQTMHVQKDKNSSYLSIFKMLSFPACQCRFERF